MDFVATSDNTSHILSLRPLQKILVTEDTDDQVDSTDADDTDDTGKVQASQGDETDSLESTNCSGLDNFFL